VTDPDSEREYDQMRLVPSGVSGTRLRVGYDRDRGPSASAIARFVVQLEYLPEGDDPADESNWQAVVRSDHGPGAGEHDVTEEGAHLDVYRSGTKIGADQLTGSTSPTDGFDRAEEHIRERAKDYVKRYQRWLKTDRKDD
jgi:hypothetical protein